MKRQVGAFEAKTHLPKLIEAVLQGDIITITRRKEAVAMLVPVKHAEKENVRTVIEDLRKWRKGITWDEAMSTQKARKEGRR